MNAFETWWHNEGSGMVPGPEEDHETHVKRIAEIAWSNGAYIQQMKIDYAILGEPCPDQPTP